MKVKDIGLNEYLYFGQHRRAASCALEDLVWRKVSLQNDFMLTNVIRPCCYDYSEFDNPQRPRQNHGNNYFPWSNMMQYLNNFGVGFYKKQHEHDEIPYWIPEGFLTFFSQAERDALQSKKIDCCVPIGLKKQLGSDHVRFETKVYLPSLTELGFHGEEVQEGEPFDVFACEPSNAVTITRTPKGYSYVQTVRDGYIGESLHCDDAGAISPVIRVDENFEIDSSGSIYFPLENYDETNEDLKRILSIA